MRQLHPTYRLLCWLLLVVGIQCLSGPGLVAAMIVVLFMGRPVLQRFLLLVRRARWLLASLAVVLAWSIAGEPLWENGGLLSPTLEGITEAATQIARLLLVLAAVAALLETTPVNCLMAGCRDMLLPMRHVGLDIDRAVVRLSLALHYAERAPSRGWKHLLEVATPSGPQLVCLTLPPTQWRDRLVLLAVAALLLLVCAA